MAMNQHGYEPATYILLTWHLATSAVSPSVVNDRLTPVGFYIALGDAGRVVARFRDKVPKGREDACKKIQLDMCSRFDTGMTAYTALA